jgi:hypothetical protein
MQRFRIPIRQLTLGALALAWLALAVACGGGGGGGGDDDDDGGGNGGDLEATFTAAASGGAGSIGMIAGPSSGADFDVDVRVEGPLTNFFGIALRVDVPSGVLLLAGSSGSGSVLLQESPDSTIFAATQANAGADVFVTAERVQPGAGFDNGVDVAAGSAQVMRLRFRAQSATSGSVDPTNTELRTCDDGTLTCTAVAGAAFTGGSLVAN